MSGRDGPSRRLADGIVWAEVRGGCWWKGAGVVTDGVLDRFRIDGKVALVTGGSRGLGREIAGALASAGAEVAVSSRQPQGARGAADEIARASGRKVLDVAADVTVRA